MMQMIQLSSTLSCQPWKNKLWKKLSVHSSIVTFHSNPHQRSRPSFWTSSKSDHSIFSYNLAVTITDRPNIYLPVRDKLSYCPWADNLKIMKTSCPALQTGTPVSRIPTTCREVNISFAVKSPQSALKWGVFQRHSSPPRHAGHLIICFIHTWCVLFIYKFSLQVN